MNSLTSSLPLSPPQPPRPPPQQPSPQRVISKGKPCIVQGCSECVVLPIPPLAPAFEQAVQPSVHTTDELTTHSQHTLKHKKACVVLGCSELIAPTMWRHHLGLHAQGLFPGAVPQSWLAEQDLFICPNCLLLVANSHHSSHQQKCSHSFNVPASCFDEAIDPPLSLPSLTDVFQAKCNTIRHIPSRDKQAFAQVLSSTLMAVVHENSEQAWLKLLMLPKSVLFPPKQRGQSSQAHISQSVM